MAQLCLAPATHGEEEREEVLVRWGSLASVTTGRGHSQVIGTSRMAQTSPKTKTKHKNGGQ